MSVSMNGIQKTQNNQSSEVHDKKHHRTEQKTGQQIFAGGLNLGNNSDQLLEQKKKYAAKQALQLISQAWEKDQGVSKRTDSLLQQQKNDLQKVQEATDNIKRVATAKDGLMEEYKIDPDSQEQKDLELLEKYQDRINGVSTDSFSKDEIKRLTELQTVPRTEYQNRVLELNAQSGESRKIKRDALNEIGNISASIRGTQLEQIKDNTMKNAQDAAADLMDASNQEIMGLMMEDAVKKADDKSDEVQKKAEEAKKEQEAQDQKIENSRQEAKKQSESDNQDELVQSATDLQKLQQTALTSSSGSDSVEEAQKNIQKIMKENDLIDDDLKGIKIDFNF